MADIQLLPRDAFADVHSQDASGDGAPRLRLSPRPGLQLATVIARAGDRAEFARHVAEICGLSLPDGPTRATAGRTAALGVGPRSWLFLEDGGAPGFAHRLSESLGRAAAVSDQSDAYAVLRVAGPAARAVLGKGLAVDLHPRAFDTTRVAVTICSHVGVTIWQVDDAPTFEVALFRSYAGSFAHWLSESAAEYGCSVRPATLA